MVLTMLAQPKIWNSVFFNIKKEQAHNIHLDDCQSSWFIPRNLNGFLKPMPEKSKFRIGAGQSEKL